MQDRYYYLPFSVFPGIGPKTFESLLNHFGSAEIVWKASKSDFAGILGEKITDRFLDFRNKFSIEKYEEKLKKANVKFVALVDKEYPDLLKQIKNPPIGLYSFGNIDVLMPHTTSDARDSISGEQVAHKNFLILDRGPVKSSFLASAPSSLASFAGANEVRAVGSPPAFATPSSIAVVGTRKITQYGREVTEMFTRDLVAAGFIIVSGLAMGVDAVAHQTTLDENGKTIAVLGCGVDCCTPPVNQNLYNNILASGGCVVSEFPLSQMPTKGSFPSRNRIIAGLSQGVLVTEGAEGSGALITADYAFQNQRKVFAVPGPITSQLSKGPYKLIQKGARLVTKAEDILQELKYEIQNSKSETNSNAQNSNIKTGTKEEQKVLEILENEPLHFDEIVRKMQKSSSEVGSLLSIMEVKGLIKSLDSGLFGLVL